MLHPDLPLELFEMIMDYISAPSDYFSLCLVSKSVNHLVTPKLYATVTIETRKKSFRYMRGKKLFSKKLLKFTTRLHIKEPPLELLDHSCPHEDREEYFMETDDSEALDKYHQYDPVERLGKDIAKICNRLPKNQLFEFKWAVGSCLPRELFGERGVLVRNQKDLLMLSLVTDGECDEPSGTLALSSFQSLRFLSWHGLQTEADFEAFLDCVETNKSHLEALDLGLGHDPDRRLFHFLPLEKMLGKTPTTAMLPVLRWLALAELPFHTILFESVIKSFNFANLATLRLWNCAGQLRLLDEVADLKITMHLRKFEYVDDGSEDPGVELFAQYTLEPLEKFLGSFCGLEELYIMAHPDAALYTDDHALAQAIPTHKATLTRLVLHWREADDLDDSYVSEFQTKDCQLEWNANYMSILDCSLLQCLGGTFTPASLQSSLAPLDSKPAWKILHLRFTEEHGPVERPEPEDSVRLLRFLTDLTDEEFRDETEDLPEHGILGQGEDETLFDSGPSGCSRCLVGRENGGLVNCSLDGENVEDSDEWQSISDTCFFKFLQWVFGPRGLPDLQLLLVGDFSQRARYTDVSEDRKQPQMILCRNEQKQDVTADAQSETEETHPNFRRIGDEDVQLLDFYSEHIPFLSMCEVYRALPGIQTWLSDNF